MADDSKATTLPLPPHEQRGGRGRSLLVVERDTSFRFPLPHSGEVLIGRAPTAHLRLRDRTTSRHHAQLDLSPDEVRITDLGSHNGTRINGERLRGTRPLLPGDTLLLSGAILLFEQGHTEAGTPEGAAQKEATLHIAGRVVVVADPVMVRLYALIRRLADSDLPVLLAGETGTGKEIAAAAFHFWSRRQAGPLVALNCAALPEHLIESELFGHEKGAFSGAESRKAGLLESAHTGVVFLDEVGELPLAAQAKLLRVLEEKRVLRLGDVRERAIDTRIVAASNRDLEQEVKAGRFRKDLYFRLSAVSLTLPPLRDRPADLPLLAQAFLAAACEKARRPPMEVSAEALQRLLLHDWPGNVRELKNTLEYTAAASRDPVLLPDHLPERIRAVRAAQPTNALSAITTSTEGPRTLPGGFRPLGEEVRDLERMRIRAALEATGGVQTRAAKLLSMPLRTFILRMNEYGLSPGSRKSRYE